MRILYHHRIGSKDGQYVHVQELIAALRQLGHEVIVIGPPATERQPFGAQSRDFHLVKRALPRALYELLELVYTIIAYVRLERAYHRHKPHILYERYNLFALAGVLLKRKHGIPMLLEVNAPLVDERRDFGGLALGNLARWAERATWRGADFVLPVTGVLGTYVRAADVSEDRIVTIPNGVALSRYLSVLTDEPAKRRLGLADRLVLGFTGFVREWHRLDSVVDLLAEAGAEFNLHLLLVGDGPARQTIERRARERHVSDRLTITGVVPHETVVDYVAAFDVALQPAVRPYASPLKMVEYMALSRAIVAPASANICETLTDGETALLFDPDQPSSLRQVVERLCRDKELRERLGAAARRTIDERGLTWEANAHRVLELGRRLLKQSTMVGVPTVASRRPGITS